MSTGALVLLDSSSWATPFVIFVNTGEKLLLPTRG